MYDTILLASDGSGHAVRAAEVAAEIARRFHSRLIMLHVFEPRAQDPVASDPVPTELQEGLVQRTAAALKGTGAVDRREFGHAAQEILRVAEQEGAGLIVLGSRGRSNVARFLLGSVSDRVLHLAHCAVMVVH